MQEDPKPMRNPVATSDAQRIRDFEEAMYALYEKIVAPYTQAVGQKGCVLHTGLTWRNSIQQKYSATRLPPVNGYECYFYCSVEKAGNVVRLESTDGEADYYPLELSTMVSTVCRRGFRLQVSLFSDPDDFRADLSDLISLFAGYSPGLI